MFCSSGKTEGLNRKDELYNKLHVVQKFKTEKLDLSSIPFCDDVNKGHCNFQLSTVKNNTELTYGLIPKQYLITKPTV